MLPVAQTLHRSGHWPRLATGRVVLGYDERFLRRKRLTMASGDPFFVDLNETTNLLAGDAFELDDGRLVEIAAAEEAVLVIEGDLVRLAWHIGNRHTPCQIESDRLVIRADHVLADMLRGLGATVTEACAPSPRKAGLMGWDARWAMRTDLLTLVQWLSPAFPTGGYAYSHGLETVIADGDRSAARIGAWVEGVLSHGAGQSDAVLLAAVLRGDDAAEVDAVAQAMAGTKERLSETIEQGAAFARTVAALTGRSLLPRALPVAVGEAARGLDLAVEEVVGVYLHAFAANLVAAATRFAPLGQTEGQGILAGLHPVIGSLADWAATAGVEEIGTSAIAAEIASMRHEGLEVRIFKT